MPRAARQAHRTRSVQRNLLRNLVEYTILQHNSAGTPTQLSWESSIGEEDHSSHPMECTCDGPALKPKEQRAWRSLGQLCVIGRSFRDGIQSLLSRKPVNGSRYKIV